MPKLPKYRFEIPEAVLGSYVFIDKDGKPARPSIQHICIDCGFSKGADSDKTHAIATNGHQLIHLSWVSDSSDIAPQGIILIPQEQAKTILDGTRNHKLTRYWLVDHGDGIWRVNTNCKEFNGLEIVETPSTYPDWRQVMAPRPDGKKRKKDSVIGELGFNGDYLTTFQRFLKKHTKKFGIKMVVPEYDLSPILMIPISVERDQDQKTGQDIETEIEYYLGDGITEVEYVLMPMRI